MEDNAQPSQKVLIILNPVAGFSNSAQLEQMCQREFSKAGYQVDFHRTKSDENLSAFVSEAIQDHYDLVVAAGGDGTVAEVASGLAHSDVPLGILPSGTWNAIARHFLLPLTLKRAIALILGEHDLSSLDMMKVGDHAHAMNLTIGFSSAMIQNTRRDDKRRFGTFAYLGNLIAQLFGLQLKRYQLVIDGTYYKVRASEVMVANYGVIGLRQLEDLLEIQPDDGRADVIVIRARTILDAPALLWNVLIRRKKRTPIMHIYQGCKSIRISCSSPAVVQADGEIIGKTPVDIEVVPRCVKVIVPAPRKRLLPEIDLLNPRKRHFER